MNLRVASLSAPLVVAALAGCSSTSGKNTGSNSGGGVPPGCPSGTGYVGDSMCLSKPPASEGFQLVYGPADFTNTTDVAPYVLEPGGETNDCYYEKTPNTDDVYVSGHQFYMRPGSHHLCANVKTSEFQPDGFHTCQNDDGCPGTLGGSQTPKVDQLTDPAPENEGIARKVPANAQAVINFHVINTTAAPIVREAWLNFFYMDPSKVKAILGDLFLAGGFGFQIPPGTHQTYQYACSPSRPVRVLGIAAHMHMHTTRMSVWHVDTSGQPSLIYENFDWESPKEIRYDSVHTNTPSNRATLAPGGASGMMVVMPGETIQWECEVNNTSDTVLTFRNEVQTGEMCIVTGAVVPVDDSMNPYSFTCAQN
jgi:hypothetical protein